MKGRRIQYSARELAFIESQKTMNRRALHAAFVERFSRRDVSLEHVKGLCTRHGWNVGRRPWRSEDDALLRKLYPDTPTADVADRLERSPLSVYQRADKLGLRKSAAYMASPAACRLRRGDNVGAKHRFPKGHVPANKGLRRPGFAPGRMSETQFKKGQATNWMPIGSTRVIDGYSYTKVSDVRRVSHMVNWKPTHVLAWTKVNGPVPKGMCLKSLDGNRQNTDPSNWELVPRALLPRLNGKSGRAYDTAPAELKPTIMAIAKLEHATKQRREATPP